MAAYIGLVYDVVLSLRKAMLTGLFEAPEPDCDEEAAAALLELELPLELLPQAAKSPAAATRHNASSPIRSDRL
jgi:hypothetical protein